MHFTQPTIHHILYIESDSIQIARHGFPNGKAQSLWVSLEDKSERQKLDDRLADLHNRGYIKLYVVSACWHGDDCDVDEMHEQLNELENGFAQGRV